MDGCVLLLRTVQIKGIDDGQKYYVSFKLPFFLTFQSYIRELWVFPNIIIEADMVLEIIPT